MTFLDIILAIIFPPLPLALKHGLNKTFWINVVLTILFYIPGLIHSLYVMHSEKPVV